MAARKRGAPGTGARGPGEPEGLPHITWPQLRERYRRAETYEERLGLIHASRFAVVQEEDSAPASLRAPSSPAPNPTVRIELATTFLTEIGREDPIVESDSRLRAQARMTLVRHILGLLRLTPSRRDALRFFAETPKHSEGLDGQDRQKLLEFLDLQWHHHGSWVGAAPLDRRGLIDASLHARAFTVLVKHHAIDAIPALYYLLTEWANESGWGAQQSKRPPRLTCPAWGEPLLRSEDLRALRGLFLGPGFMERLHGLAEEVRQVACLCGDALVILSPKAGISAEQLHEGARALLELLAHFEHRISQDPDTVAESERLVRGMRAGCDATRG